MGLIISVILAQFSPLPRVIFGVGFILTVHLSGALALRRVRSTDTRTRVRVYSSVNALAGVGWGLFWWVTMPAEPGAQLFIAIAIPFAMAVNMVESGPVPQSFLGFHIPYSIISVVAYVHSASGTARWAPVSFGLMAVYTLVLSRVMASSALERAELTVRNADLISELNGANEDLERQSTHDRLTGLANRLALERFLENTFTERAVAAVEQDAAGTARVKSEIVALYLDLDRFKDVNDTRGHAAGDELLIRVSRRLQRLLPDEAFAARIGGDEMVVILSDCESITAGEIIAGEIVECMAETFELASGPVQIGASVGVAITSPSCTAARNLLHDADSALYQAKATGRSHWVSFEDPTAGRSGATPRPPLRSTPPALEPVHNR